MTSNTIYVAESLHIEDDVVHIEQYRVPVTATFEETKATLTEQNAEISVHPPTDAKLTGTIHVIGYDGFYYLKFSDTDQLLQIGAKEGNGHRKGDYNLLTDE